MLDNCICLMADKDGLSLVVKQLEDGGFVIVTIDSDRKRAHTQTTDFRDSVLAMMEAFAPWEDWRVPEV